jgi:hypothetical protein
MHFTTSISACSIAVYEMSYNSLLIFYNIIAAYQFIKKLIWNYLTLDVTYHACFKTLKLEVWNVIKKMIFFCIYIFKYKPFDWIWNPLSKAFEDVKNSWKNLLTASNIYKNISVIKIYKKCNLKHSMMLRVIYSTSLKFKQFYLEKGKQVFYDHHDRIFCSSGGMFFSFKKGGNFR